jgi:protein-tyrosine-phosphatase
MRPAGVHLEAVRTMRRQGIDVANQRSKHVSEFAGARFDLVVTVCDRVREECAELPTRSESVHWSVADPAQAPEGPERRDAFDRAADELRERVRWLVPVLCSA